MTGVALGMLAAAYRLVRAHRRAVVDHTFGLHPVLSATLAVTAAPANGQNAYYWLDHYSKPA
jgi:hypothetical protein